MSSSARRRDDRLEVRLTPKAKALLKRAASTQRKTVSAFVLESGLTAAAEALADRQDFRLSTRQYDAFVAALDAPTKPKPRLDALLKLPSILE